jgi:hypothetical protein
MQEPNFSEAQLQVLANIEICNLLRDEGLTDPFPRVIPPYYEDLWGWDTGFRIPWLGTGHPEQQGCNLFIQYKLSCLYSSNGAYGWESWYEPFYRFKLGYRRNREWDYLQRDHLVMLANDGYRAIYVTNHVLDIASLIRIAYDSQLCSRLPALQIRNSLSGHGYVSFTDSSLHFRLHSDDATLEKNTVSKIVTQIQPTIYDVDINNIQKVLENYEKSVGIHKGTVRDYLKDINFKNGKYLNYIILWWALRRYLNIYWFRYQAKEERSK